MDCPDCAQANPEHARFCLRCGRSLATSSPAAPAAISDERRLVTVLFADIVGSTGLAGRLDAEDYKGLINGALAAITPPIYRYGGDIPQFLGDGFLALFGAPTAHEDDAQRAVRAALELIDAAGRYRDEVRDQIGAELAVRVGIHSGPAVFGAVGTELRTERLAVGETVNVAARLQTAAEPMTAVISESTRRLLPDGFELEDVGPIEVRGMAAPMAAFVPKRAPQDGEAGARPISFASPMVGRSAELQQLRDATVQTEAGVGRLVVLLGEPGIGKSRLLREWRAGATERGVRWAQANMPSHATGEAYRLAGEAVRAVMGLEPSAGATELALALDRMPTVEGIMGARHHLADLLAIPLPEAQLPGASPLSPQGLQGRYIQLTRAVVRDAATEPLILVLNDVHWADQASIALLTPLLSLHAELPFVICIAARPDADTAGWRLIDSARSLEGGHPVEIPLDSLPGIATAELVANLLDTAPPPDGLLEFVNSRAEGNPLFVEEVVRMVVDAGVLVRSGGRWQFDRAASDEIPQTLQALLAARIDRLDAEARTALRVASVIGRQFSVDLLDRMLGRAS